jgi:hypothetical protein
MNAQANDRITYMTDLEKCMNKLEDKGYTNQYRLEDGKLRCIGDDKTYLPEDVVAVNFYRFEGISDPDDMSILYAIETVDGSKGTLVDAYGLYADDHVSEFMRHVEIHKSVKDVQVY